MKRRLLPSLLAMLVLAGACGPSRIRRLPLSPERIALANRLMIEGDRLLLDEKDHLALTKYVQASQANPYSETIFNKLAITYTRIQMFPQARKAVNRSLGLNRNYAFAHNTKGIILLAEGRPKKSIPHFRRAIRLRPAVANFYLNLGHAYMQLERYEEGKEAYRRALELDAGILERQRSIRLPFAVEDEQPEHLYELARIYAQLGDKANALFYLERALQQGFLDVTRVGSDPSFDKLRLDEDFGRLLSRYGWSGQPH